MRLCFTSDLHLDQNPEVADLVAARSRALGADVLVIAGDLGGRGATVEVALARLADGARTVFFVPGNHDLWCREHGPTSRERYLDVLPGICARAGVRFLPSGPVVASGVTFVGQTGWYDYSLRDPGLEPAVTLDAYRSGQYGKLAWTDRFMMRWPGLGDGAGRVDDEQLTAFMDERLVADLAAAPRDRPAVVVTHMLPFEALAPRRPLPWGFVRGFLGARSTGAHIVGAAAAGLDVRLAISGHTHFARHATVSVSGGRRFAAMTRPIGYPREQRRMGFADLAAMVEHRVTAVDLDVPAHARRAA